MATISELTLNIMNVIDILNRLSNALSQNVSVSDENMNSLNSNLISFNNNINSTVTEIEGDIVRDDDSDGVSPDISSDYLYGIGETCLLLDPFDNYRVFNLYTDYTKKKPLNLADGQVLYLVFKYGNKEIKIPEYNNYGSNINIDKENGQVLFKISKTQATDILSMRNKTFYITRVYETYNKTTDTYIKSDEEVLFSGYWAERTSEKESKYLQQIEQLQKLLNQKEEAMQGMIDSINQLVTQNAEYSEDIKKLEDERDVWKKQYDDICEKIEQMGDGLLDAMTGEAATGEIIDSRTILLDYSKADDDTKERLDQLTGTSDNVSRTSINDLEDVMI